MAGKAVSEPDEAFIETLRKQVQTNPEDADNHRQLGLGLFRTGEVEQAQEILEAANVRFPDNLELQYALAIVLKGQGDFERAHDLFMQVAALAKSQPDETRYAMIARLAVVQAEILDTNR
jgi:cytochrome c-type biogenesis protein CcmH/NrfG